MKADREGGGPVNINITKLDINGFTSKENSGENYFIPPCLFYGYFTPDGGENMNKRKVCLVFFCIPVSPGNSRLIFAGSRNFAVWIDRLIPRWIFHMNGNLVADSDLNLLHLEVNSRLFFSRVFFFFPVMMMIFNHVFDSMIL